MSRTQRSLIAAGVLVLTSVLTACSQQAADTTVPRQTTPSVATTEKISSTTVPSPSTTTTETAPRPATSTTLATVTVLELEPEQLDGAVLAETNLVQPDAPLHRGPSSGLQLPPAFALAADHLFWIDGNLARIGVFDTSDGSLLHYIDLPEGVLALDIITMPDGRLAIANRSREQGSLIYLDSQTEQIVDVVPVELFGEPMTPINSQLVAAHGGVYLSDGGPTALPVDPAPGYPHIALPRMGFSDGVLTISAGAQTWRASIAGVRITDVSQVLPADDTTLWLVCGGSDEQTGHQYLVELGPDNGHAYGLGIPPGDVTRFVAPGHDHTVLVVTADEQVLEIIEASPS